MISWNQLAGVVIMSLAATSVNAGTDYPPAWVMETTGDLVDAQCVEWSGSLSIDKQQILALGRKEIAARIQVKVTALDESYQSRVSTGQAPVLRTSFVASSKQMVDAALQGSQLARLEVVKNNKGHWLCGLVQIPEPAGTKMAREIVQAPGNVDRDTEEFLLAQFRQQSARTPKP